MRPPALTATASGAQRLVWLLPSLLLCGISDTDVPTASCAAALVGASWQLLYRRPVGERLVRLAAASVVALGLVSWTVQVSTAVAFSMILAALVGTEHALRAAERGHAAREEGTVPAGT